MIHYEIDGNKYNLETAHYKSRFSKIDLKDFERKSKLYNNWVWMHDYWNLQRLPEIDDWDLPDHLSDRKAHKLCDHAFTLGEQFEYKY